MTAFFNVRTSGYVFALLIFMGYAGFPFLFAAFNPQFSAFQDLARAATISSVSIAVGFWLNASDPNTLKRRLKIELSPVILGIWLPFLAFATIVIVTAPSIPLISSILGADSATLSYERETFLKARTGWEASFVYINALFTGAILPMSISLLFVHKYRFRWLFCILFLLYSFSFVEKAFFLKLALPLMYLVSMKKIRTPLGSTSAVGLTIVLLIIISSVAGAGSYTGNSSGAGEFFSRAYEPTGVISHIIWRTFAVPVFTAGDAIAVYLDYFRGRPLWGATSSFISFFGGERVQFERLVFEAQWGQNETGTGSSNTVYLVEAFINFGYTGIILFSLFVGQSLKWMANSRDEAFRSLWPLYCFNLYSSGLIGILLSNGFIIVFLFKALFQVTATQENEEPQSFEGAIFR